MLLQHKACVDLQNNEGSTALMAASEQARFGTEAVRMLLERGAQCNMQCDRFDGYTALTSAARNAHHAVLVLLLEHRADPIITPRSSALRSCKPPAQGMVRAYELYSRLVPIAHCRAEARLRSTLRSSTTMPRSLRCSGEHRKARPQRRLTVGFMRLLRGTVAMGARACGASCSLVISGRTRRMLRVGPTARRRSNRTHGGISTKCRFVVVGTGYRSGYRE